MSHRLITTSVVLLGLVALCPGAAGQESIVGTRHNLSVTGPGPFKALSERKICIFCHAPHHTRIQAPLWNREDSSQSYLSYFSSTFQGTVAQPNGSTKLCLSCHDGTIALGQVLTLPREIAMAGNNRYLSSGRAHIGTDLRDDHPVSFPYRTSKGGSGLEYKAAGSITPPVMLDSEGRVQCTSCHDPHSNLHGWFLRRSNQGAALCLSCHEPDGWQQSPHSRSAATWNKSGQDPWPYARYGTVTLNGCANCHRTHNAGQPQRLLNFPDEEDNCLRCHNGNVAQKNVAADFQKVSVHRVSATRGLHDPAENPLTMRDRHVECQDCHNPHQANATPAAAPAVSGPLWGVKGVDGTGQVVGRSVNGYQICYKCHADNNGSPVSLIPRQIVQTNVRLEFDPSNPSFHPIEAVGRNPDVPSLTANWTPTSIMTCWDCHNSDASKAFGGNGPNGPHGSTWRPLLGARLDTGDNTPESSAAYALCYKCHSRTSILGNNSFSGHRKHIVEERTPCTVCHDPHGISSTQGSQIYNTHLINFDTRVVFPDEQNNWIRFIDTGTRTGQCWLRCHSKDHRGESYGPGG